MPSPSSRTVRTTASLVLPALGEVRLFLGPYTLVPDSAAVSDVAEGCLAFFDLRLGQQAVHGQVAVLTKVGYVGIGQPLWELRQDPSSRGLQPHATLGTDGKVRSGCMHALPHDQGTQSLHFSKRHHWAYEAYYFCAPGC